MQSTYLLVRMCWKESLNARTNQYEIEKEEMQ